MGTYILDKTEADFDESSLIDKVDDGYEITVDSFKLRAENPYQPHISESDNNDVYISYLYYGNDSYYERRRQEYRKYLSLKEIHLAILRIFPDERRIAIRIKKESYFKVKISYATENEVYLLDIRNKEKVLLDNISCLYEIISLHESSVTKLDNKLINSKKEIENMKLYIKEKCKFIFDIVDK
ncbi:hypothetical protein QE177_01790 [Arsenophonus sp. aPb]|uniref:hypothetical protein n=1 Tax=Arsenophonus sp. aPb TaxID=3041619 RepID=UPI002469694B|nr:hypothetical protein [Arsenophonus sp. aPb]WGL98664.1 hypothetical protein QE177_01790 [Arsenophonus sp. aPb]